MKAHGPVYRKNPRASREIWIKRGGPGSSGSGASGWKNRPSKALARALAEMAVKNKPKKRAGT